jgi:hypothetical protein
MVPSLVLLRATFSNYFVADIGRRATCDLTEVNYDEAERSK